VPRIFILPPRPLLGPLSVENHGDFGPRALVYGAVETQGDLVTLAWHGLDPVLFVARRCFGAEPYGDPAVRVHPNAGKRAIEPYKLLIPTEAANECCHRP